MASNWQSRQCAAPLAVFSSQLWQAVGLQHRSLSISRSIFFPEGVPCSVDELPASSFRTASERQQRGASSRVPSGDRIKDFHQQHKRLRASNGRPVPSGCFEEDYALDYVAVDEANCEAFKRAPRKRRTGRQRRLTTRLDLIAASLGLSCSPSLLSLEAASVPHRVARPAVGLEAASSIEEEDMGVISEDCMARSSPPASVKLPCDIANPSSLVSHMEKDACCTGRGDVTVEEIPTPNPGSIVLASHSATSSQGVFGDACFGLPSPLPSPLRDAAGSSDTSDQQHIPRQGSSSGAAQGWTLCSPVSEEGSGDATD